jgi:8-oxo-dGTP pyrophosphatase MutT (NUDIX family)
MVKIKMTKKKFPLRTISLESMSIPPQAKLAFKGKVFEVWQWEQRLFDGSVETFEQLKRQNTAQVIPVIGDNILIQLESQPNVSQSFLSLPGGRCFLSENSLDAAKRELLEETGYTSDDWILCKEQNSIGRIEWTVYTYIARNCVFKKSPELDSGEKIETRLISFEEFLMLTENPLFYERELIPMLLYVRFDEKIKEEFHNLLFKK